MCCVIDPQVEPARHKPAAAVTITAEQLGSCHADHCPSRCPIRGKLVHSIRILLLTDWLTSE